MACFVKKDTGRPISSVIALPNEFKKSSISLGKGFFLTA